MKVKPLYNSNIKAIMALFFLSLLTLGKSQVLGKSLSHSFENGLNAVIYSPDEIEREMLRRDRNGNLFLVVRRGWEYELIEHTSDSSIAFEGDGRFHPHQFCDIVEALSDVDIDGYRMELDVEIYLLPYPRRGIVNSTAAGYRIFLSPGVYEPESEVSKYLVTHELGHCVQKRYLPESDAAGWERYMDIRGISEGAGYEFGAFSHMKDPLEIFAEDFRYLYGGGEARYPDGIENAELLPPDRVRGLNEYFCSIICGSGFALGEISRSGPVSVSNYPNPFNPVTTIRVLLDRESVKLGSDLSIRVYDTAGRMVKEVYSGVASEGMVSVQWNGTCSDGASASSGIYFYSVTAGGFRTSGKMLLIR